MCRKTPINGTRNVPVFFALRPTPRNGITTSGLTHHEEAVRLKRNTFKKLLGHFLRWVVPAAIIAWLVVNATKNDSFSRMRDAPKQWDLLAVAAVLCFSAVALTIVRWYFLVRTLQIPLSLRDAFRLGFLGYLYNFITPGSVGGDLFKAVFLAHGNQGRALKRR